MTHSRLKTAAQSFWMMWEHTFDKMTLLRSESVWKFGICKLVVRKHIGRSIQCHDEQWLHAGDWLGELHLDNQQVLELSRTLGAERAGLATARMMRQSMKQIGLALSVNEELSKVQAVTGITLLHRGIIHGLGFEMHPLKSRWYRQYMKIYLRLLLRVLHPEGKRRMKGQTKKLVPMRLMMSKQALLSRWVRPEPIDVDHVFHAY